MSGRQRVAWVTGASSGIGEGITRKLIAEGWRVYASARRLDRLQALQKALGDALVPRVLDVTDNDATLALAAEIFGREARVDLVLLNAGVDASERALGFSVENFEQVHSVNVLGTAKGIAAVTPHLKAQGTPGERRSAGTLAVVASVAGYVGLPHASAYCSSKAAAINLVEAIKPELEVDGIDVKLVNPGFIRTDMTAKNTFEMPFLMELDQASDALYRGLTGKGFEIVYPWQMKVMMKVIGALPYSLLFWLTRKTVGRG